MGMRGKVWRGGAGQGWVWHGRVRHGMGLGPPVRAGGPVVPRMTEAQFTQRVIDTARLYSWLACHFRPARTERGWRTPLQGDSGFPDLVLARRGVVLIPELKVGRARPRPDQVSWGVALGGCYRLWYPEMWEEILAELRNQ